MLFNEPKKVNVFKCKHCKQYTAVVDNRCRYCQGLIDYQAAQAFINAEEENINEAIRKKNSKRMLRGLAILAVGLILTMASFALPSSDHIFRIYIGAIILGCAHFFNGLSGWLLSKL